MIGASVLTGSQSWKQSVGQTGFLYEGFGGRSTSKLILIWMNSIPCDSKTDIHFSCWLPTKDLTQVFNAVHISFYTGLSFKPETGCWMSIKKGNAKECSNYHTIALISHASKVMLKILQARLQQYLNHELPDVQAGVWKGRGIRDQIANNCWIIKNAREFQRNIYFCFIDFDKGFGIVNKQQ